MYWAAVRTDVLKTGDYGRLALTGTSKSEPARDPKTIVEDEMEGVRTRGGEAGLWNAVFWAWHGRDTHEFTAFMAPYRTHRR